MKSKTKALLSVHIAIFLLGASGLFAKWVQLPSLVITFGRTLFSSLALLAFMLLTKKPIKLAQKKHYGHMIFLGILLAVHWYSFYEAIQLSTVALGLLSFSTFPVFVTFLQPLFTKQKLYIKDVIIALIVFGGVLITVPSFEAGGTMLHGILVGVFSGFSYAILTIFNKSYAAEYSGEKIAFYEQAIASLVLLPFVFIYKPVFTGQDILLLVLLGVIFTGLAHTLFINSLKSISSQTASIITCLEPIYSILLAMLTLNEIPSMREIIGGVIILSAVVYSSLQSAKATENKEPTPASSVQKR